VTDPDKPFVDAILASPEDAAPLLIYADWLKMPGLWDRQSSKDTTSTLNRSATITTWRRNQFRLPLCSIHLHPTD
jgi:hypothetical protein